MTAFAFTDTEIAKVTGYIKDDNYIASLYGVSVHRVRRLRHKRAQEVVNSMDRRNLANHLPYSSSERDDMHITDMQRGSNRLREKLLAYLHERNNGAATL
jgi:hypothetical protein